MKLSLFVSSWPLFTALIVLAIFALLSYILFYALKNKGEVLAEFSLGKTSFRLQAKERTANR